MNKPQKITTIFIMCILVFQLMPGEVSAGITKEFSASSSADFLNAVNEINGAVPGSEFLITLTDDILLESTAAFSANTTTILGGGHQLMHASAHTKALISVNGGTVNLGSPDQSGTLTITGNQKANTEPLVYVNGGALSMYDGVAVTDNATPSGLLGSGITVNTGIFNMYGGEVTGNVSTVMGIGAGVTVLHGNFTMYGGLISGNIARMGAGGYIMGAGVAGVHDDSIICLNGGTVANNTCEASLFANPSLGGGVCALGALDISDSMVIANNHAASGGDDIYAQGTTTLGHVPSGLILDDTLRPIDGWYRDLPAEDDTPERRWNMGNPPFISPLTESGSLPVGTYSLKAAYDTHEHTWTQTIHGKAATCTEEGLKTYYQCVCEKNFEDQNCTIEITEDIHQWRLLKATGHDWQDPVITRNSDGKTQTATFVCKKNEAHVRTEVTALPQGGEGPSGSDTTDPSGSGTTASPGTQTQAAGVQETSPRTGDGIPLFCLAFFLLFSAAGSVSLFLSRFSRRGSE